MFRIKEFLLMKVSGDTIDRIVLEPINYVDTDSEGNPLTLNEQFWVCNQYILPTGVFNTYGVSKELHTVNIYPLFDLRGVYGKPDAMRVVREIPYNFPTDKLPQVREEIFKEMYDAIDFLSKRLLVD